MAVVQNILFALGIIFKISESYSDQPSFPRLPNSFCLNTSVAEKRSLVYPNGSLHAVSLSYPDWASARVIAVVSHILLEEVLGYSVSYFPIHTQNSKLIINAAAGCVEFNDMTCRHNDIWQPFVHLVFEMAPRAYFQAQSLPLSLQPALVNVMAYLGDATLYVWLVPKFDFFW